MAEKFAGISLKKKIIMGILNLSSETFYRGSLVKSPKKAANRAEKMVEGGAEIIDIGGMSTGPHVDPISEEEELNLILPAVEAVRAKIDKPISVDTQRAEVAKKALEMGAEIVNDVSGLKADPQMPQVVAEHDCPTILMANRISGRMRTAEKERKDIDTMEKIKEGLNESLQICKEKGTNLGKVAVDPGIGFGRDAEGDLKVLSKLDELSELNKPICIGVSRKSFIGEVLGIENPSERLSCSLAATVIAVKKGANIVRTHDPKETNQSVRIFEAISGEGIEYEN